LLHKWNVENDQACNKLPTFNCFVGYLFTFLCLCDVIFDISENREMEFSNENVINAVQNEGVLWDATINASEEQKELAWNCIADLFGFFRAANNHGQNHYGQKLLIDFLLAYCANTR